MEGIERDGVTILDVLGLYPCARAILDYLPVRELVRSERVCRQGQRAVQDYLHTCRSHNLYNVYNFYLKSFHENNINYVINRKAQTYFAHKSLFTACETLEKFAPGDKVSDDYFKNVISSCPYLRHLNSLSLNQVCFENCNELRISELNKHKTKGAISKPYLYLTEDMLKHIKSNELTLKVLRSAIYCLGNITTLKLDDHNAISRDYVHLLLNAMPQLEKLYFCNYTSCKYTSVLYNDPCTVSTDDLILSICRLTNLKHLHMRNNTIVNDTLLEELAMRCEQLEYLDISYDSEYRNWPRKYSARGVAALCRGSLSITTLSLGYVQNFTSITLETFVRDLPVVQELGKLGCYVELTPQWLEETSLASQTMHPLELIVRNSNCLNSCLSDKTDEVFKLKIVLNTDLHTEQQFSGQN